MKKIVVIANGFAEEMMATKLIEAMREECNHQNINVEFMAGSLVSSGKWYKDSGIKDFYSGGVSPSGGFPRTIKSFLADLWAGAFWTPIKMISLLKQMNEAVLVIAVGDFLLMSLTIPMLKKFKIPLAFIPTAKSRYIAEHFTIEKKYIKKYATISYPRDKVTTEEFENFGIHAKYFGNLMQDLLDQQAPIIESEQEIIALLPGSREESYGNFAMILDIVEKVERKINWILVRAGALKKEKFDEILLNNSWTKTKSSPEQWTKSGKTLEIRQGSEFDSVAKSCNLAISLAGTVSDQIMGLGKPVLSFVGTGPQSSKQRMLEYKALWGDAFVYAQSYPDDIIKEISTLLTDSIAYQVCSREGIMRMGERGATKYMAKDLITLLNIKEEQ